MITTTTSLTLSKNLSIEYVLISILKPNPKNSRFHPKHQIKQLIASMEEFGFLNPVLIDKNNMLVCGHGRVEAAKKLGITEVPAIRVEHLTEAQILAFMIAENKLTENAKWNKQRLTENFQELALLDLDFAMEVTGFETGEIDLMVLGEAEDNDPADEIPEVIDKHPITKRGDLWMLGTHRVYCGDCLDPESFVILMVGDKAIMIFVDPPYNVKIDGHVGGLGKIKHAEFAMASGEMSEEEFTNFLHRVFSNLIANSVDGSIHFCCMDFRHGREILTAGKVYSEHKNICVWVKDNAGMGSFYRSQHEFIHVFKHGSAPHINNFELGQHGRYRTNVWQYPGVNSFSRKTDEGDLLTMHPTVKPVQMVADAIMDCSKRGGIILDCFLGSGTTLIAAEKTGRVCYGMEIEPIYVDTTIRRWQAFTGKDAVHALTGKTFNAITE